MKPNPKKYEADVTKQVNDIIVRNDMKHREDLKIISEKHANVYGSNQITKA